MVFITLLLKILVYTVHTSAILSSVPLLSTFFELLLFRGAFAFELDNAQKLYALEFNMISSEDIWLLNRRYF